KRSVGLTNEDLWGFVKDSELYTSIVQGLNEVISQYRIYDVIQIVNPASWTVVLSSIENNPGQIFAKQHMQPSSPELDYTHIFTGRDPLDNSLNLFFSHPILLEEQIVARLIVNVNTENVFKPMLNTGEGLRKSGEAFLVDSEMKSLTTLKHSPVNGPHVSPNTYVLSKPALLATQGEEGITIGKDYRNRSVVAAFRHIPISNELKLGLVVKRDEFDIFRPITKSVQYTLIICFISIVLAILFTYIIAEKLSYPIQQLSKAALLVSQGDLKVRVQPSNSYEHKILGETFNSMVQHLGDWHTELESQVKTRTDELRITNSTLKKEILERKNAENAAQKRAEELKHANIELEEFNYVASHDLKEPLRTLTNYCELLKMDVGNSLSKRAEQDIIFISDAASRMSMLVSDLRHLSAAGRVKMTREDVDLNVCMKKVTKDLELLIEEAGAKVEYSELPVVKGDFIQLNRVFQNLIENAVKFRADSLPRVKVEALLKQNFYEIRIHDNGIGIDPRFCEQIFLPFKRLHSTSQFKGTGIGLAICQKIIHRHEGSISVESAPGKGSLFKILLKA
ncbi:MAG: ATP-binding protein, partial [Nitrospinota bacterium]